MDKRPSILFSLFPYDRLNLDIVQKLYFRELGEVLEKSSLEVEVLSQS